MRVIAGSHRGRRLCGPQGTALRPTSDKVREALFSILADRVPGGRVLDSYAGTGAVGVEALSRGASAVTFVESSKQAVGLLKRNLAACELLDDADIYHGTVETFLKSPDRWKAPYDVWFADPPYAADHEVALLHQAWPEGLMAPGGVLVIEQHGKAQLPKVIGPAMLKRRYRYGDTALWLYEIT